MTLLSVNINKLALLRNSRGTGTPDLVEGARLAIAGGAEGITVHPREDQRHITLDDVIAVADLPEIKSGQVEFNVEGDMREDLFNMIRVLKPTQFTVVPVIAGEVTSSRGWRAYDDHDYLEYWAAEMREVGVRTAVFVDPEPRSVELAAACTIEAVEVYTGAYAAAHARGDHAAALEAVDRAAQTARGLGLRLNGGHDLTVENLGPLCERVQFDEFSIGHHIASEALFRGFSGAVADFKSAVPEGV